jgi:hypothetical protein
MREFSAKEVRLMKGAPRRSICRIALGIAWMSLIAVAPATAAEPGDDLPTLFQQARDNYQPPTEENLSEARADLAKHAQELERYLGPGSTNGQKWKGYLHWEKLEPQLKDDAEIELGQLVDVYRKFNSGQFGLEQPPFRRTSDSLRHLIDLASVARLPDSTKAYGQQLDALEASVKEYNENPSARRAVAIGQQLDLVEGLGQAPELVDAVRRSIARPNVYAVVSSEFLSNALSKAIDDTEPVYDTILGTRIRGTAKNAGSVTVRTVPAEDRAILEFTSTGHVKSSNVGNNGPAVIRSSGVTDYTATKQVELTADDFRGLPTQASATTRSDIHSISKRGGGLGSQMVSNVGWDKARQQHGRADSIASSHAEDRIRSRFDREMRDALRDLWDRYAEAYRNPLLGRGQLPKDVQLSTTDESLNLQMMQGSRGQLGAAGEPPSIDGTHAMAMRAHESAANNYATAILGGATLSETAEDEQPKIDTPLPKWVRDAWDDREVKEKPADFKAWSLTLRRSRPVTVTFEDDGMTVTLHMARLQSGSDDFRNWDAMAKYQFAIADGGLKASRAGDVEFLPTEFDPQGGRRLTSSQVALRSNLNKIFNEDPDAARSFPQSLEIKPIEFSGDFAHVAPLQIESFSFGAGWMSLAWDQEAGEE